MGNISVDYYNNNAQKFISSTQNVDFSNFQNKFCLYLKNKTRILDFGCGTGRDAKTFIEAGYHVDAIDGSVEMVKFARTFCNIDVKHLLFEDYCPDKLYDGIWACASLLHLSKYELCQIFPKLHDSLEKDGILYASFKYGSFEGIRKDRYFTDFIEEDFLIFIENFDFIIIDMFVSSDVRPERNEEKWLNVFLKRIN